MSNGWTGAQYSVYRCVFGAYLFAHFARLLPWGAELFSDSGMLADAGASPLYPLFPNALFVWDAPGFVVALLAIGAVLSVAFALGMRDRIASVLLWYLWACLFTRNPLISSSGLPFVGWLLLAHALLPRAPYGAWDMRGRLDPGSGWRMPAAVHTAAWIVMALAYFYSGVTGLASPSTPDGWAALLHSSGSPLGRSAFAREMMLLLPGPVVSGAAWSALSLELSFAPLALVRRLRPWLWLVLLGVHLVRTTLLDLAELSAGLVLMHLFTFDPAWVKGAATSDGTLVFYDGDCGLCHRVVRFLLAEDVEARFRYAPIAGEAFDAAVRASGAFASFGDGKTIPDSVMVRVGNGPLLVRSAGVLELGRRLGGVWRLVAIATGLVPSSVRDAAYDWVARTRRRLFAKPEGVCPVLPPGLRSRFDL